ncbi:MAG: leucine-rich repeat protein [Clostridia bacterium]|nr:leucine-rich repeat protein [Clostridia bacterium]
MKNSTLTNIGDYTFERCTNLTSIIIPDSVTHIGNSGFLNCTLLTIYCEATSKPNG